MSEEEKIIKAIEVMKDGNGDKDFMDILSNCESNMYSGKDEDGNDIVVMVQKDVGVRVSTKQSNGWTRHIDYDIIEDDDGDKYVSISESYDK